MVVVPARSFMMGSPAIEKERGSDAAPRVGRTARFVGQFSTLGGLFNTRGDRDGGRELFFAHVCYHEDTGTDGKGLR
jgi:hypothetical protein